MSDRRLFLDEYERGALPLDTSRRYTVVVRSLRLELLDSEGQPIVGEPFRVYADDSESASGRLDGAGGARVPVLFKASYQVSFPNLHDGAWGSGSPGASDPGAVVEAPYVVQRAETLQMILYRECGALDLAPTMAARGNELLFKTRSPQVLYPGDRLLVPRPGERGGKRLGLELGAVNRFCTTGATRRLRLTLKERGKPLAAAYTLEVAGLKIAGVTDATGALDEPIPLDATQARLTVNGRARTLVLGGLDPLHTVTGIQARLNNLGFHTGAVDGVIGPITRRAIRKFQASRSLIVDGIVGPKTREALARAHGEVT
jgi:N-acetylmuramoyl-L-alanine amidase